MCSALRRRQIEVARIPDDERVEVAPRAAKQLELCARETSCVCESCAELVLAPLPHLDMPLENVDPCTPQA